MELTGRVALITGVGRREGIGVAIARELAAAGASVFLTFFRKYDEAQTWGSDSAMPQSLLEELGPSADAREFDLSDSAAPAAELIRASPTGAIASARDTARVVRALVTDQPERVTGQILRVQPGHSHPSLMPGS